MKVAVVPCLVNGRHGSKSHGNGGELPKVRHKPWVRVAGQTGQITTALEDLKYQIRSLKLEQEQLKQANQEAIKELEMTITTIPGAVQARVDTSNKKLGVEWKKKLKSLRGAVSAAAEVRQEACAFMNRISNTYEVHMEDDTEEHFQIETSRST